MRLKGKTAFISGAGRNNGRTIALTFACEGADVILIARHLGDELNQVAKQCESLGVQALPLLADMSKHEEVNRVVRDALERFGKIDVLVSATGMRLNKSPWDFRYDKWQQMFAVNLHSTFDLAKALAPKMIERGKGGSIMALGGNSAFTSTSPKGAALAATKHGLYGFIKSLAQALGPHGIRANLLALANIENERRNPEWYANTGMSGDPETPNATREARSPLRRTGKQQEVANVALFLASDESSYITGDRIVCAGGVYM
jgi:3-oxoacyl-[acyl-carrier protein] reductase